jgi:Phosphotransferase enzyme family
MDVTELEACAAELGAVMMQWVAERLAEHGMAVTGAPEPRLRPWSITMRVPTDRGSVWFKANAPAAAFEPPLMLALGRLAPGHVLVPLATDLERGWSLLPDAGARLREALAENPDLGLWEEPLRHYAAMQRRTATATDELLGLGVPDLRPQALPERFDALLALPQVKAQIDQPQGVSAERFVQLQRLRPRLVRWCERLAEIGVPPTVEHSDLHDGQAFRDAVTGRWVFIDWGDSSVGHPFVSLHIVLRWVAERYQLGPDAPELARLRDAYLEPWTAEHGIDELREAAELAVRLGVIPRALAWLRVFPEAEQACFEQQGRDALSLLSQLAPESAQ